jgi:hypothetical protein
MAEICDVSVHAETYMKRGIACNMVIFNLLTNHSNNILFGLSEGLSNTDLVGTGT